MVKGGWVRQSTVYALTMLSVVGIVLVGCARLPYTTKVVYEGPQVKVALQHEVKSAGYSHPVQLTAQEVTAILRGFSLREEQRLPLRWFAEETAPKQLFREDELARLCSYLVDGLRAAGPNERVHFALFAPGMNPADARSVTAGWIAVREPYLYLGMEYFHTEVPIRTNDNYYQNYPLLPPEPKTYLLFFEPGRFWVMDQTGTRGLEYRQFLKAVPVNGAPGTSSP
ncbi:MAG: hypothetical protein KGS09_13970 [Nitrospirae bacterium]|nr:hypothetical protein [Nitrospirota bacterium]MDE3041253.1 hypothetical protein [Nitrospirota bacterium]